MPDYTSVYTGAEIDGGIAMAASHASRHATGGADAVSPASIGAVPTTRTVNGHALSSNVSVTYADVGAVPTTRKVNSKALSSDISLTASDVGAVPTTRTVNNKALSSNVTLVASDVSAVPVGRTVNGKALSSDISLTYSDVAAVPVSGSKVSPSYASSTIVSMTANKTLALSEAGCLIQANSSSNLTLTVPTNASVAFPTGTEIEVVRYGTGTLTIAGASGVTIRSANSLTSISSQYATAGLKKMGTNEWLLTGSLM